MSTDQLQHTILALIKRKDYQPVNARRLARAIGIAEDDQDDFNAACKSLVRSGRVVLGGGQLITLPPIPRRVIGAYRGNRKGFGFVVPDAPNAEGDLYIPSDASGGAVTGDTVVARVKKRGKRQGKMLYEGQITEIVTRGHSRFVGEMQRRFGKWMVQPDGTASLPPILVDDPAASGAREGDQVVVEIVHHREEDTPARGVIVKVLGEPGRAGVDTRSIIEQYEFADSFHDSVLREARVVAASFGADKEVEHREDLRKTLVITIDPVDARDFDDAISVVARKDGSFELGVHIADVAFFVRPGTELDAEAKARSTSVYLTPTVVPMLPEVISNGVCSLQEERDRLTKSAFITYDRKGAVKAVRLANTLVRSAKRLTYEEAEEILSGKEGSTSAEIVSLLGDMERLAKLIRQRRIANGMLELDLPEIVPVFGEDGSVIDAVPASQSFPHKIIEMFMIEANEAVARTLAASKVPFLRRVHPEPDHLENAAALRILQMLGHSLPKDAGRSDLQALLNAVRGKSESFPVNLAVLRTMQKAEYAPAAIGHYALASTEYCHFTSPIRRYPDLTVHRLIDLHLSGGLREGAVGQTLPSLPQIEELGTHCSIKERQAESAERELKLLHILRLLEKRLGDEFDSMVTGVSNTRVFVQIGRYEVEGAVPLREWADEWWEVDSAGGVAVGERSGRRIALGDRLRVRVATVDCSARRLELAPADAPSRSPRKENSSSRRGKAGSTSRGRPKGKSGRGRAKSKPAGKRRRR